MSNAPYALGIGRKIGECVAHASSKDTSPCAHFCVSTGMGFSVLPTHMRTNIDLFGSGMPCSHQAPSRYVPCVYGAGAAISLI